MNDEKKKKYTILVLILIIIILLYLLIRRFGIINNRTLLVPTGNVDIFEIDCSCCDNSEPVSGNTGNNTDNNGNSKNELASKDILVYDNYKIWDNKRLRIFSNPAYNYESIIAPGSENSYAFVIRNNNDFDVVVDISFIEENANNINMRYKLTNNGNYLVGTRKEYEKITDKKFEQILIPKKSYKSYILDWKWVDSDNDTIVGFDITSEYKLQIHIGAN